MAEGSNIDKKPVFMFGRAGDGKSILIFGIPETAYDPAPNGHSFDFDFTSIGLPIYTMIFKGMDHADCMKQIEDIAKRQGVPLLDERRKDFSIKGDRKS
jgi:hypothetical protein